MAKILDILCVASLLAMPTTVRASIVYYQFSGTVSQVPTDEVFGDITFGDALHGTFSFDSSAVDLISDPATGSYNFNAPFGMVATVGTHAFSTAGSLNIGILNGFVDQFTVLAQSASGDLTLELFLEDFTGTVFGNDHLPLSPPPVNAFAQRDFHLDAILGGGEVQVDGQIDALQAVPEPAQAVPVLMFLIAVFAWALCTNKLNKRRSK